MDSADIFELLSTMKTSIDKLASRKRLEAKIDSVKDNVLNTIKENRSVDQAKIKQLEKTGKENVEAISEYQARYNLMDNIIIKQEQEIEKLKVGLIRLICMLRSRTSSVSSQQSTSARVESNQDWNPIESDREEDNWSFGSDRMTMEKSQDSTNEEDVINGSNIHQG